MKYHKLNVSIAILLILWILLHFLDSFLAHLWLGTPSTFIFWDLYGWIKTGVTIALVILVAIRILKKGDPNPQNIELTNNPIPVSKLTVIIFAIAPFIFSILLVMKSVGFEIVFFLYLGPILILTILKMIQIFRTHGSNISTILTSLLVILISILSLRLNLPIITDGDAINWFSVAFFSSESWKISSPLFSILLYITPLYFFASLWYTSRNISLRSHLKKAEQIVISLIGIVLILSYILIFFSIKPSATQAVVDDQLNSVYQHTFIDRKKSNVTVNEKEIKNEDCAYAHNLFERLSAMNQDISSYSTNCIDKIDARNATREDLSPLPFESSENMFAHVPMSRTENAKVVYGYAAVPVIDYKKGDIFAVTAFIPKDGYLGLDAQGNTVSEYSSTGIFNKDSDTKKVGNITYVQSSESVVSSFDTDRTITMLYPINTEDDIHGIKMILWVPEGSQKSVKILEVARIRGSFQDPEWLTKKAGQSVFTIMSVSLKANGSRGSQSLKYGSSLKLTWTSSEDIQKCMLMTGFINESGGHYPMENFNDLSASGEKSVTLSSQYGYLPKFHADLICDAKEQEHGGASDSIDISITQ